MDEDSLLRRDSNRMTSFESPSLSSATATARGTPTEREELIIQCSTHTVNEKLSPRHFSGTRICLPHESILQLFEAIRLHDRRLPTFVSFRGRTSSSPSLAPQRHIGIDA